MVALSEQKELQHLMDEMAEIRQRQLESEKHSESRNELLIRIDERTRQMQETMLLVQNGYVRKEEFTPVKEGLQDMIIEIRSHQKQNQKILVAIGILAILAGAFGNQIIIKLLT